MFLLACLYLMTIAPVTNVRASDKLNDAGSNITISWTISPDDTLIEYYDVQRRSAQDTVERYTGRVKNGVCAFEDNTVQDNISYTYVVAAVAPGGEIARSEPSNPAHSYPQVFHSGRINVLVCILIFLALVLYFVRRARRDKNLFIRKIAGLAAVEDAIGRATEMGKPILYVPGLWDIDSTATIASMNILGEIAKKIARYDTPLIVTNRWSVTYTISKEIVKEAFISQGHPDKFKNDYIRYLTEDQFGFAAAVDGIMLREKPAANFFIGYFWAESLILAETGAMTGAIQIAGTDAVNQLPFFVAACDYTLLGEELYAASAYLAREPALLGALKAQDYGKVLALVLLAAVTILAFFGLHFISVMTVR
jgi:hypothetical protein